MSIFCANKRACEANERGKRRKEKSSQYSSSLVSHHRLTRYWISAPFSLCEEERLSSSPSRVFLACSPSRKSSGSTGNLPSYCSPPVIRPTSDPLSWPLFQISARLFSLQRKETNSAAMASTLLMRAPIYTVVA